MTPSRIALIFFLAEGIGAFMMACLLGALKLVDGWVILFIICVFINVIVLGTGLEGTDRDIKQ